MNPRDRVIERVRATYGAWHRDTSAAEMRRDWDALFESEAKGACAPLEPVNLGELPGAWVRPADADPQAVLLYFHGGGYRLGSSVSHHRLAADLAGAAGIRVLLVDYRRAPEYCFPAARDDALTAWYWLRKQGHRPENIAVGGDSAGGHMALSMMLALRDRGEALPAAGIMLSAWTDLSASGESFETRDTLDPIHDRRLIQGTARGYLGPDRNPADPECSPLFADLSGLPPLLLQVGDHETVLSDTTAFTARAQAAGVYARAEIWPEMIHVFQQFVDDLPEAQAAISHCGAFLRRHLLEVRT